MESGRLKEIRFYSPAAGVTVARGVTVDVTVGGIVRGGRAGADRISVVRNVSGCPGTRAWVRQRT